MIFTGQVWNFFLRRWKWVLPIAIVGVAAVDPPAFQHWLEGVIQKTLFWFCHGLEAVFGAVCTVAGRNSQLLENLAVLVFTIIIIRMVIRSVFAKKPEKKKG